MKKKPKKILRISDVIFILPDNFNGTLQNALMLLASYLNVKQNEENFNPKGNVPIKSKNPEYETMKVSMEWGIFEIDENGNYHLL